MGNEGSLIGRFNELLVICGQISRQIILVQVVVVSVCCFGGKTLSNLDEILGPLLDDCLLFAMVEFVFL